MLRPDELNFDSARSFFKGFEDEYNARFESSEYTKTMSDPNKIKKEIISDETVRIERGISELD